MNRPHKIPFAIKLFAAFSVGLFTVVMLVRLQQKMRYEENERLRLKIVAEQDREKARQEIAKRDAEERRTKAEFLAAEAYEKLRMANRNQLYLLCTESGDIPLFFMDKVVCLDSKAVVWQKYDGNPEKDTSGDPLE